MAAKTKTTPQWPLASVALDDAYTDFILSRQAMKATPATLQFYGRTAGVFWIEPAADVTFSDGDHCRS